MEISVALWLCLAPHAKAHVHSDIWGEAAKKQLAREGKGGGRKEIGEDSPCIITLSRWHIYRLCQRGHAFCRGKRSEVWKSQLQHTGWPFNNYYRIPSTHYRDGDCDSARNYNIILSHPPARTPCFVTGGDRDELWRISTIREDVWNERAEREKKKHGRAETEREIRR